MVTAMLLFQTMCDFNQLKNSPQPFLVLNFNDNRRIYEIIATSVTIFVTMVSITVSKMVTC